MDVYDAITKRRAIRKFRQKEIQYKVLERLVNAARLAPSGANLQPLEYVVVDSKPAKDSVFGCLEWARHEAEAGPKRGEEPAAYIVILINRRIMPGGGEDDAGVAAENICLAALGEGLGSCILGSVNRDRARKILEIPEHYVIALVIALGYPAQKSVADDMLSQDDTVGYWLDDKNVLHIPKRRLQDIMHRNSF
jgi:nitroreductase